MTKNESKRFELDGVVYERKESGYCYRDNTRIREEMFVAAERDFEVRSRIPEGVREDINFSIDRNGHHYVQDWAARKYYCDGEEISKRDWDVMMDGGTPAPSKPRRKKSDVAFEHDGVTLTAKQLDFLHELAAMGPDELLADNAWSGIWCDILCDQIGGQFAGRPMTTGAMISTLCEKGLGTRTKEKRSSGLRERTVTVFTMTELGKSVFAAATGAEIA